MRQIGQTLSIALSISLFTAPASGQQGVAEKVPASLPDDPSSSSNHTTPTPAVPQQT
jgi:hypothetical protein